MSAPLLTRERTWQLALLMCAAIVYGFIAGKYNPGWWYNILVGVPLGWFSAGTRTAR